MLTPAGVKEPTAKVKRALALMGGDQRTAAAARHSPWPGWVQRLATRAGLPPVGHRLQLHPPYKAGSGRVRSRLGSRCNLLEVILPHQQMLRAQSAKPCGPAHADLRAENTNHGTTEVAQLHAPHLSFMALFGTAIKLPVRSVHRSSGCSRNARAAQMRSQLLCGAASGPL